MVLNILIYVVLNNNINKNSAKIVIITLLFLIGLNGNYMYNSFCLVPIYRTLIALVFYSIGVYTNSYLKRTDINNTIFRNKEWSCRFMGIEIK